MGSWFLTIISLASVVFAPLLAKDEEIVEPIFRIKNETSQDLQSYRKYQGLFVDEVMTADNSILTFVSVYDFDMYNVKDGKKVKYLTTIAHTMIDFEESKAKILCSHRLVIVLTDQSLYLFKLSEDYTRIEYTKAFPAKMFPSLQAFDTTMVRANFWDNTLLMKTGTNELHILDLRVIFSPKATLLTLPVDKGSIDISYMLIINYGKSVLLEYTDGCVLGFNFLTSQIYKFEIFVYFENVYASYDYVSNYVLILVGVDVQLFDSDTGKLVGFISNCLPKPVRSLKFVETGTSIIQMYYNNLIGFLDIEKKYCYKNVLNVTEQTRTPTSVVSPLRRTNIIQTKTPSGSDFRFDFLKLDNPKIPNFCHKTCGGNCEEPFVPCKNFPYIALSMGIGVTSTTLLLLLLNCTCSKIERCRERRRKRKTSNTYSYSGGDIDVAIKGLDHSLGDIEESNLQESLIAPHTSVKVLRKRKESQAAENGQPILTSNRSSDGNPARNSKVEGRETVKSRKISVNDISRDDGKTPSGIRDSSKRTTNLV